MSLRRAFLAVVLALTWCSAAWHVDLEAVGLMFEHEHRHQHDDAPPDRDTPRPCDTGDDHEPLWVRDVVKDGQIRVGASAVLWFALVGVLFASALQLFRRRVPEHEPIPIGAQTAPPSRRIWQFVQRCAPESAAPPALA